jgi:hypothetical protein
MLRAKSGERTENSTSNINLEPFALVFHTG